MLLCSYLKNLQALFQGENALTLHFQGEEPEKEVLPLLVIHPPLPSLESRVQFTTNLLRPVMFLQEIVRPPVSSRKSRYGIFAHSKHLPNFI